MPATPRHALGAWRGVTTGHDVLGYPWDLFKGHHDLRLEAVTFEEIHYATTWK